MKRRTATVKDRLLLVNTSHETNMHMHAVLAGVFDLAYTNLVENLPDKVHEIAPRLVIFELHNVTQNGFQECSELAYSDSLRDIPVIVIIDAHDVRHMRRGFYQGLADYIVKPLIPAEVLARICGQLELASATLAFTDLNLNDTQSVWEDNLAINQNHKILLVDDCMDSVEVLAKLLRQNHFTVTVTTSATEALRLAKDTEFDLAILDVVMPDMSGYELCKALKTNESTTNIPVIFLTGQADIDHETLGFTIGAVDYITKPASLNAVLARIKVQLKNTIKLKTLEKLTYRDGLTQTANRRHFTEVFELEYKRAKRDNTSIGILVIDIDHFKLFNNYFGQLKGDDCLRVISNALTACRRRPGDLVSRSDGDEFIILLPNTDYDGVKHVSQLMLNKVRALAIKQAPGAMHTEVTISIGASMRNTEHPFTSDQLLKIAGRMLTEAKSKGRNRIAIHNSSKHPFVSYTLDSPQTLQISS